MNKGKIVCLFSMVTAVCSASISAQAGTKLYSPHVEQGVVELEYRGSISEDEAAALDDDHVHKVSIGYGVTDFWYSEVGGNWRQRAGGNGTEFVGTKWENVFQIIGEGSHFVDLGFLAEYVSNNGGRADKIEFGPLIEKQIGDTVTRFNLILSRELGSGRNPGLQVEYGVGTHYEFADDFYVGVQAFGALGPLNDFNASTQQEHRAGPVIGGEFELGFMPGDIKIETGYLRGLTSATPDETLKWQLEYEIEF